MKRDEVIKKQEEILNKIRSHGIDIVECSYCRMANIVEIGKETICHSCLQTFDPKKSYSVLGQ